MKNTFFSLTESDGFMLMVNWLSTNIFLNLLILSIFRSLVKKWPWSFSKKGDLSQPHGNIVGSAGNWSTSSSHTVQTFKSSSSRFSKGGITYWIVNTGMKDFFCPLAVSSKFTWFSKILYQLFINFNFFVNSYITQLFLSSHKVVVLVPNYHTRSLVSFLYNKISIICQRGHSHPLITVKFRVCLLFLINIK